MPNWQGALAVSNTSNSKGKWAYHLAGNGIGSGTGPNIPRSRNDVNSIRRRLKSIDYCSYQGTGIVVAQFPTLESQGIRFERLIAHKIGVMDDDGLCGSLSQISLFGMGGNHVADFVRYTKPHRQAHSCEWMAQ